jgi:hypothetical protein
MRTDAVLILEHPPLTPGLGLSFGRFSISPNLYVYKTFFVFLFGFGNLLRLIQTSHFGILSDFFFCLYLGQVKFGV